MIIVEAKGTIWPVEKCAEELGETKNNLKEEEKRNGVKMEK